MRPARALYFMAGVIAGVGLAHGAAGREAADHARLGVQHMFLRSKLGLGLFSAVLGLGVAASGALAGEHGERHARGHDRGHGRGHDDCAPRQVYIPRFVQRHAPRHHYRPVYRPVVTTCAPVVVQRPVVCAPAPVYRPAPVCAPAPVFRAGLTIIFND